MEIHEILNQPYARLLIPADDGTYFAEILEFPGCFSQGDTPDEAMENLNNVAADWIQSALELGQQIPEPNLNVSYSGRFALRLPKSIHKRSAIHAERDQTSLNQFFLSAIATRVGVEDFCERLINRIEEKVLPVARTIIILSNESFQRWEESSRTVSLMPFTSLYFLEESKASNIEDIKLEVSENA